MRELNMISEEVKQNHEKVYKNMPLKVRHKITMVMQSESSLGEGFEYDRCENPENGVFCYYEGIDKRKRLSYASREGKLHMFNVDIEYIAEEGGIKPIYYIGREEIIGIESKKRKDEKIPGKLTLGWYENIVKENKEDIIPLPEVKCVNEKHMMCYSQNQFMDALESLFPEKYNDLMIFITKTLEKEYNPEHIKVGFSYKDITSNNMMILRIKDENVVYNIPITIEELLNGGMNFHTINII